MHTRVPFALETKGFFSTADTANPLLPRINGIEISIVSIRARLLDPMPCVCPTLPPAFCFFFFHPSGAEVYCVQRYKNSLFPPPPSTKRNEKEIFVDRVKRFAFFHFLFSSSSVFHSLSLFFISKRYVFGRPSEKFSIIQRLFASLF